MINKRQETRNWKQETGEFLVRLKFKVYSFKLKTGYTLIEFLIVISILSLSVGSILLFLTSTLKGANQANVSAEVKQNGQSVLDNLQSQIRSAKSVSILASGYLTAVSTSDYTGISGMWLDMGTNKLTIICFNTNPAQLPSVQKNGWIGIAKKDSTSTDTPESDILKFQTLTNQDTVSGVDIVCNPGIPSVPMFQVNANNNLVIINFTANQGKQAPSRADFLANAQFQTTVGIRLYQ